MLAEEGSYCLAHSGGVTSALSSQTLSLNSKVPRLYLPISLLDLLEGILALEWLVVAEALY